MYFKRHNKEFNKNLSGFQNTRHNILQSRFYIKKWAKSGFFRAFHFEDEDEGNTCDEIINNWLDKSPRELIGYIPWMFNIPDNGRECVFEYLIDDKLFFTEFGLTTVEKTNKRFLFDVDHECLWNV